MRAREAKRETEQLRVLVKKRHKQLLIYCWRDTTFKY